jgi:hypothetical protein
MMRISIWKYPSLFDKPNYKENKLKLDQSVIYYLVNTTVPQLSGIGI